MLSLSEQKRPGGGAWPAAVLTHRVLRCNINCQEMRNPALRIELSLASHLAAGGRARVINGVETAPTMQRSPDTAMPISERLARATHAIGRLSAEHVEARVATAWHTEERREALRLARQAMAESEELEQLARMGLYRAGADAESDRMLALNRRLATFLRQDTRTPADPEQGFAELATLLTSP